MLSGRQDDGGEDLGCSGGSRRRLRYISARLINLERHNNQQHRQQPQWAVGHPYGTKESSNGGSTNDSPTSVSNEKKKKKTLTCIPIGMPVGYPPPPYPGYTGG